jgi:hypothetical protein
MFSIVTWFVRIPGNWGSISFTGTEFPFPFYFASILTRWSVGLRVKFGVKLLDREADDALAFTVQI